jgi:uncharacterized protein (TIRG00374 family)
MKHLAKPGLLIWLVVLPPLIWWALRAVPFGSVRDMLAQLNLAGLLALLALDAVILLLFSGRGWLILRAFGCRVNYLWLAAYRLSAFSISYFTPGQQFGGEPLQVYWLHKRHQVAGTTALTAVALDRLFDMLSNFTFLMAGIVIVLRAGLLNGTTAVDPRAVTWLAGLFLLPLAYLLAIWAGRSPLASALTRLPRKLRNHTRLSGLAGSVAVAEQQAASLLRRKPATILWLGLVSGMVWLLTVAEFWLMVHLFGQNLTLVQTILALTAARLAFLTPLPGGLGALEAGQVLAMQAIGLEPALGISVSLLIRARDISLGLAGIGIGAWLSRESSSLPVTGQAAD